MIGPFDWIDLLFLVTIALLVFNGIRNGAVFSLLHLLSIPIAFGIAYFFGKPFTLFLASNNLPVSPLIGYIIVFFGAVLILHIIGTMLRGVMRAIPLLGLGDVVLGGLIGFVEAWLLWLVRCHSIRPGTMPTTKPSTIASLPMSTAFSSKPYPRSLN